MAAAAQTAAAAEAAAASLDVYMVDGRCRRLEARDMRRRDAPLRRSRRHLTRKVLTRSACFGSKAWKHDDAFGRLTKGHDIGKGIGKVCGFCFVRFPCVFLGLLI
jgi:hypothetical protein